MVGSEICRLLASKALPFRALVRETSDQAKVERLKDSGAKIVKGNLCDPASLKAACQGVDTVICTVSAMPFCYLPGANDIQSVDLEGVNNLIDAAKATGVKQFIYTSFSGNLDRDFPLRNAKRAVEQHLKESGLVFTILRPSMFMEVWLSPAVGFDAANTKATIYGTGDQPIAWITIKDVARFAVESLTNPAARNKVLELGGPQNLSPHQVIKLFEKAKGKTFEVTYVSPEALQAQYDGATDPMQKSFIGLMTCYAAGDPIEMGAIQKSFGFRLTPVKEHIEGIVAKA
jgi:NADH dehydrogenase